MATINFLFRSTKEEAPLTLRLLFRHNNADYVFGSNTKLIVSKEYWTKQHNNIVRVFFFFVVGKKIILTHGFIKTTEKTPKSEIEKAKEYKKEYEGRKK